MARITFSPIVVDIRGKTKDVVFSIWKGINYIRSRVTPSNPRSALQTAQRDALKHTLTMWQSIKSWAKDVWDVYATGYALSGYNRYMDDNILLVKAATAGTITPFNAEYQPLSAQAAIAGASGVITYSWTDDDASADDKVKTYYRKTETGKEEYAWTFDQEVNASVETASISGLTPGEEYEVAGFAYDTVDDYYQLSFNKILVCGV